MISRRKTVRLRKIANQWKRLSRTQRQRIEARQKVFGETLYPSVVISKDVMACTIKELNAAGERVHKKWNAVHPQEGAVS